MQRIVSRRGSSKILSFGEPHVLKALQILSREGYVSRKSFCSQLGLGEGSVKTLISHMREEGLADSIRAGTFLTKKGSKTVNEFLKIMPHEYSLGPSKLTKAKNNHAIILRNLADHIKSGIEQRDAAIVYGAIGAMTMIFKKNKFVFPGEEIDCLNSEEKIRDIFLNHLKPSDGDVIILASASTSLFAEFGAKNSALQTIAN